MGQQGIECRFVQCDERGGEVENAAIWLDYLPLPPHVGDRIYKGRNGYTALEVGINLPDELTDTVSYTIGVHRMEDVDDLLDEMYSERARDSERH